MGKPISEKESRATLMGHARANGCEEALQKLFDRYDAALKGCKTNEEYKAVQTMGIMEFNQFFGKAGLHIIFKDGTSIVVDDSVKK